MREKPIKGAFKRTIHQTTNLPFQNHRPTSLTMSVTGRMPMPSGFALAFFGLQRKKPSSSPGGQKTRPFDQEEPSGSTNPTSIRSTPKPPRPALHGYGSSTSRSSNTVFHAMVSSFITRVDSNNNSRTPNESSLSLRAGRSPMLVSRI